MYIELRVLNISHLDRSFFLHIFCIDLKNYPTQKTLEGGGNRIYAPTFYGVIEFLWIEMSFRKSEARLTVS